MKRSGRPGKIPSSLSEPVHQDLNMYAISATAAGVSLLALAQPADAKIVYTPTHVVISPYGVHLYDLDLSHNGETDFVLQTKFYSTTNQSAGTQRLIASGVGGNGLENYAEPLKAGKSVGPHKKFENRGVMASAFESAGGSTIVRGPWANVNNQYLGLKFKLKGQIHYGWARLTVQVDKEIFYLKATLTGYAYETIPNKLIIAGDTKGVDNAVPQPVAISGRTPTQGAATLGALAMGSPGLSIWRREESLIGAPEPS